MLTILVSSLAAEALVVHSNIPAANGRTIDFVIIGNNGRFRFSIIFGFELVIYDFVVICSNYLVIGELYVFFILVIVCFEIRVNVFEIFKTSRHNSLLIHYHPGCCQPFVSLISIANVVISFIQTK